MASEQEGRSAVGAGGLVTIVDRVFTVRPLSLEAEIRLGDEFRKLAMEQMGPGGYFADAKPVIDWLQQNNMMGILNAHVKTLSELQATKVLPSLDAADKARESPDGVALEMFYRTRETHPDVTLSEFRAVINAVNAASVHAAIRAAVSKTDDPKTIPNS